MFSVLPFNHVNTNGKNRYLAKWSPPGFAIGINLKTLVPAAHLIDYTTHVTRTSYDFSQEINGQIRLKKYTLDQYFN